MDENYKKTNTNHSYKRISANYLDLLNKNRDDNGYPRLKRDRQVIIIKDGLDKRVMDQLKQMNNTTKKRIEKSNSRKVKYKGRARH